jgi:CheY-like chemotaxis protein
MALGSVFIVDDDPDMRSALALAIEEAGYSVSCAENGKMALELLAGAARLPRLILLDLVMPVMNGGQFLDALQEHPRLASLPVVIMSALGDSVALAGLELLSKPLDLDKLLVLVSDYCGEARAREIG